MSQRFFGVRAVPWLLSGLIVFACSLDERTLQLKPTGGLGGGSGTSSTTGGKGGSGGGRGGTGMNLGGSSTEGGEPGDGGTTNQGGFSGSSGGFGGTMGGSGNAAGSGGIGGGGGSGGKSMDIGDCADLDENGVRDCDETLADNPNFATDTSGWNAEDGATQAWSNKDARDRSGSGSIQVTNVQNATGNGQVVAAAGQCVTIVGNDTYQVRTRVFVDSRASHGTPGLYLWFYDSADCSGSIHHAVASVDLIARGEWQPFGVFGAAPAQAGSMRIRLAAVKNYGDPDFEVFFDDVLAKAVEAE
jgi:hypothetical protein